MEKPPFQFGLKSIFLATTGVAIFMAAGEMGWILVSAVVLWCIAAIFLFAVAVAIILFVEQVIIDVVRLLRWTLNQYRLRSGSRPPEA